MKQIKPVSMILVLFATITRVPAAQTDDARVMLEAARKKQVVDGDLNSAIQQYKAIVAKYPKERAIAAESLIRMAECYQKLGDPESKKIYARIVREYADQKDSVAIAQARLGTDREAKQTGTQKVWSGNHFGTISQDGRRLLSFDNDSNLILHDVADGTNRLLTKRSAPGDCGIAEAVISRDGAQAAYNWCNAQPNRYELRLVSLQGTGVPPFRRLYDSADLNYVSPLDWSPDGKYIAVRLARKDRTVQLGLVDVQDGSLRVLKSVDWRRPTNIFFSPDGRDLAFDLAVNQTDDNRDVFVLAADGSREIAAVLGSSRDIMMGWSPDGKYLLFASDRKGSMGLWALPFAEGKPNGPPILIRPTIDSTASLGVTSTGSLYYRVAGGNDNDIEVVSIDLDTGKQIAPPVRPIKSLVGIKSRPEWSVDGKYLAYVSARSTGRTVIVILDADSGDVMRELPVRLNSFTTVRWAPDGRSFAVAGTDFKGRDGVFRIDAQTGDAVPLVLPPGDNFIGWSPEWSPDGKRIYYRTAGKGFMAHRGVVEHDLVSGEEREVIHPSEFPESGINLSPNGRWMVTTKAFAPSNTIWLVPVDGGQARVLLHVNDPQWLRADFGRQVEWTPDSRGVILKKMLTASGDARELWFVPITGEPPRKLDVDVNHAGAFRLHPDGRRLAFVVQGQARSPEVWVMENFLPALKANQ